MKVLKRTVKLILFILIFAFIFSYLSNLFCRKSLEGTWNQTQKISGFYNEPKNDFDIIFFGSSNTYCSFNPLVLYEQTGLKSYVFASQQQPVWATYSYIKEALKTQNPQLLVVDVLMFSKDTEYYDDGVNYSYMDDIPLSKNKIELAAVSAPNGERLRLLINFIKYHSRWSELTREDYEFKRSETNDFLKGYTLLEDIFTEVRLPAQNITDTSPLSEKEITYFYKIIELAKEHNIPLFFVKAPSNADENDQKLFNSIQKLAEDNGVQFVNYNNEYDKISFNINEDFYDKSHLNYRGADVFTKYFAKDMQKRFSVHPHDDVNSTNEKWEADLEKYYKCIEK